MKKLLTMIMIASMFSLVACGPNEEEAVATEEEAAEMVEEMVEAFEEVAEDVELAEHVCNDECQEDACNFTCGEKGHECTDACHAEKEGEHEHAEGEEHDHSEE